jgi:predicted DCC family thiol-disulfide oxidoreductase YuxK
MKRRCPRCGESFEIHAVADRYCPVCDREVRALLAADERRQAKHTFRVKDFTGTTAL